MIIEPISPQEVLKLPDITATAIDKIVDYINLLLTADHNVALLQHGESVRVFDSSDNSYWLAAHKQAVQKFRDMGWLVATVAGEERVYVFSVPPESVSDND